MAFVKKLVCFPIDWLLDWKSLDKTSEHRVRAWNQTSIGSKRLFKVAKNEQF